MELLEPQCESLLSEHIRVVSRRDDDVDTTHKVAPITTVSTTPASRARVTSKLSSTASD